MYIIRWLFKIFWTLIFITGCSGSSGSGNNYVGGSGATEVGTNLVVTANSYEVPVNTSVKLSAYTISGTNHAIDEVTSAADFKHDKDGLLGAFSTNDIVVSDNTVKYSKAGTYTVYATHGEYTSSKITIKVVDAVFEKIVINSPYTTIPVGQTMRLTATGFFYEGDVLKTIDITNDVDWNSANSEVLMATNIKGAYKANVAGSSAISISWKNLTDKLDFNITNDSISSLVLVASRGSMVLGSEQRINALAYYANGAAYDMSGQVSYNIMPASAASIRVDAKDSNIVWLTAKEAKPVTITATYTDGKQRQAMVSVNSVAIEVSDAALTGLRIAPEKWTMGIGQNYIPSVVGIYNDGSNSDVTKQTSLASSNADVVTINNLGDGIRARGVGSALITAKLGNIEASNNLKLEVEDSQISISQIKILASSGSLAVGGIKQQYSAVAVYANGGTADISNDPNIVWQIVGDNDVAQINAQTGLLTTGNKVGDIRVQVDYAGKIDSVGLSVVNEKVVSLTINAPGINLPLGSKLQYNATAHYNSGKSDDVTNSVIWRSESPSVAVIDPYTGELTALNTGNTTINASLNSMDGIAIKSNTLDLKVVNDSITKLVISAPANSLPAGGISQQYKAFAYYGDGGVYDVTTSTNINWSVSGSAPAAIIDNLNHKGLLTTSVSITGTVTVNAIFNGVAADEVSLVVVDRQPRQLVISASQNSLPVGISQQYKAYAIYDNFDQSDVTDKVTWSIDNTELATITPTGVATTKALGTVIVSASLPTTKLLANSSLNINSRQQLSLILSPSSAILPVGLTQHYQAIAFYDNGESADVSSSVNWSSSVPTTASITNGLATGLESGNTVIKASLNGQTAIGNLTVNNATLKSVSVVPATLQLALNTTYQLKAIGSYDNITQQELSSCNWTSNNAAVTVDALTGAITAHKIGNAVITATCGDKKASSSVGVVGASISSLKITPGNVTVAVGNTESLYVVASYNNGSQEVLTNCSWVSDNAAIATISNNGVVRGITNGSTTIKASCTGWGSTVSAAVTVQDAVIKTVQITPKTVTLPYKSQYQLRAIASYDNGTQSDISNSCQWSSNNTAAVAVNAAGLLSATTTSGSAQISASCNGFTSTANVTVQTATLERVTITPSSAEMAVNTQQKLEVVGSYINLDQVLISEECGWSSSSMSIATVENTKVGSKGLVKALTSGDVVITATCPNSKSVTAAITVRAAALKKVLISPESANLPINTTYQLNAIGTYDNTNQQILNNCSWNKLNSSTASNLAIRESDGLILTTGNVAGIADIRVTCGDVVANTRVTVRDRSLRSVKVSPSTITIPTATSTLFEAIGVYDDGSSAVQSGCAWSSSESNIATVSTLGNVSANNASGNSIIMATCGAFSSTGTVTVAARALKSLQIVPESASIPTNTKYKLQAFGSYDDYSLEEMESCVWSKNAGISSINVESTTGNVSAGSVAGFATIQASCSGKTVSSTVTVTAKTLTSVAVAPSSKNLSEGEKFALSSVGSYNDGSAVTITSGCTWASANTSVATVESTGVVTGVAAGGPVNVTATCSGKSGSAVVTINSANRVVSLINDAVITDVSVPVNIRLPVRLTFKTESGNITNFKLLSPSLNGMPVGWTSESSTQLSCSQIASGSNQCSVNLTYYPLDKTNRYKGVLNIVYTYTNNLGQEKYEVLEVKYGPSNRYAYYTTGSVRKIGRCTMDDNDKYVVSGSCKILTIHDLNDNIISQNEIGTTTGINFYEGSLYFSRYGSSAANSRLYKCNVDTSDVLKCSSYLNNTLIGARGIFIDKYNIMVANSDSSSNNISRFFTASPSSGTNLFFSVGVPTNDIAVDKLNGFLFASVASQSTSVILRCAYNPVSGNVSNCANFDVPGMAVATNTFTWGIATYLESTVSGMVSHVYIANSRMTEGFIAQEQVYHCEVSSSSGALTACGYVTFGGLFSGKRFDQATKIDIVDGIAYVLEHGQGKAIYQCDILGPVNWRCNNVIFENFTGSTMPAESNLSGIEMMAITGRSD